MPDVAPCIPFPIPQIPTLPNPFSIPLPSFPGLSFKANVCCIDFNFPDIIPPIPLGPLAANLGIVATLNAAIGVLDKFLDALPIKCPRAP